MSRVSPCGVPRRRSSKAAKTPRPMAAGRAAGAWLDTAIGSAPAEKSARADPMSLTAMKRRPAAPASRPSPTRSVEAPGLSFRKRPCPERL